MKHNLKGGQPPVICFSNLDWGYLRYRKQQLMSRLAAYCPVVYVNPPRAMKWRRIPALDRFAGAGPNLSVYEPIVLPGIRTSPRLRGLNYRLMARDLARFCRGAARPILWIYSPHAYPFIRLMDPALLVYDIADNYAVPSGAGFRDGAERREVEALATLERRMLAAANIVLCVSEPLVEMARSANKNVHLVPNGCDFDRYRQALPASARRRTRPRIGYVGTVAPRFDVELVLEVARTRPGWDIEIVGPISPLVAIPKDATPPNLKWRGEIPYESVASTIEGFDVCVLPLRDIPFSYCSSPIQVWDYLAAGRAVVSTPVAQFEKFPEWITTARGAGAFSAAIDECLRSDGIEKFERRRSFAGKNTWTDRVGQVLSIMQEAGFPSPVRA